MNSLNLQDRRVWFGGGALAAVILVAASWFLFIHPKLADAADVRSQTEGIAQQNSTLAAKNTRLAQQHARIGAYRVKLIKAIEALPPGSDLPAFTEQVTSAARANGVTLGSINIGSITPVAAPVAAAPTDDGDASTSSSTDTSTQTTTPATTTAAPTQFTISVTLATAGTFDNQVAFVESLQHGARSALLTSTQLAGGAKGSVKKITQTIQVTIFTAPMSSAQLIQLKRLLTGAK